jgi:hypothetical protein
MDAVKQQRQQQHQPAGAGALDQILHVPQATAAGLYTERQVLQLGRTANHLLVSFASWLQLTSSLCCLFYCRDERVSHLCYVQYISCVQR